MLVIFHSSPGRNLRPCVHTGLYRDRAIGVPRAPQSKANERPWLGFVPWSNRAELPSLPIVGAGDHRAGHRRQRETDPATAARVGMIADGGGPTPRRLKATRRPAWVLPARDSPRPEHPCDTGTGAW